MTSSSQGSLSSLSCSSATAQLSTEGSKKNCPEKSSNNYKENVSLTIKFSRSSLTMAQSSSTNPLNKPKLISSPPKSKITLIKRVSMHQKPPVPLFSENPSQSSSSTSSSNAKTYSSLVVFSREASSS